MNLTDSSQFYKGYKVDYNERTLDILLEEPNSDTTLFNAWDEAFAGLDKVNVCLSGGIDSQFALSVMQRLGKQIHVYIFQFIWEDNVFNSPDVLHAIRYCERFNHPYTIIDIDYKHFLHTGQHLKICKSYKARSPQIALQLKMIDLIDDASVPVVLGGDVPLLEYDPEQKTSRVIGLDYQPYMTNAFLNYGQTNNRIVVKDLFRITPEIFYLGFRQFLETTKAHNLTLVNRLNGAGSTQPIRKLIYSDIGADLIPPLIKQTGFEILKMHLAKLSGVYNQYDVLFRYPLENTLRQESWFYLDSFKVRIKQASIQKIKEQYETFCNGSTDLKFIDIYNFIL